MWKFGKKQALLSILKLSFSCKKHTHLKLFTNQVAVGGVVEEPPEGDDRGENGEVDEEEAGHALDVERVFEVAPEERRFPLDVLNEPAEQSFLI